MSLVTSRDWAGESDVRRLNILYELLAALSRATGPEEVYDAALTSLLAATSADRAAILLFDDDGVIRFKAWRGLSAEYRAAVTGHTPWRRGLLGAAPIVTQDVLADESLRAYHDILTREGIRGLCFIPLALASGVFGKFMLYYSKPNECAAEDITLAEAIAAHVALATERKQIEEAAQRTERRFQAILDNAAAVIFLKDLEGRYQLVNRRFEELFHIKKGDALGKTDSELFNPEIASRFRENDERVLKSGTPLLVEESAPHDDGLHSYISMKFPLKEADGTVSGVGGLATDITDRKRAEEEREVLLGREQEARRIAQLLNQVGPRLATQLDFKQLVQDVTDMATSLVGAEFGSFFHNVIDQKGESYMLYTLSGAPPDAFAGFPMPRNTALFGPTYRGEGVVCCDDVTKDPRYGKSVSFREACVTPASLSC
jgi:PAS domain S-box-containing protein